MSKVRKEQLLKELHDLENEDSVELVETPTAKIQEPKEVVDSVNTAEKVQAPKKPRTEKQIEAFNKAIETRKANEAARKAEREAKEAEEKRILEDKLVKKAIAIKKRQLKKEQIIEEIAAEKPQVPQRVQAVKPEPVPKVQKPQLVFKFY
jgi:hypothetical protein